MVPMVLSSHWMLPSPFRIKRRDSRVLQRAAQRKASEGADAFKEDEMIELLRRSAHAMHLLGAPLTPTLAGRQSPSVSIIGVKNGGEMVCNCLAAA